MQAGPIMSGGVLAVVVNHGLAHEIQRLLASGCLRSHDVLLVDNASQPAEIRDIASRHGAEVMLLDRNWGFAGGVNRALRCAPPHDHVLLVNPDVELTAATIDRLRAVLEEGGFTAVSPLLVGEDGELQIAGGGAVTLGSFLAYFLFASHLAPRLRGVFYTRHQIARLEPVWLGMACLMIRADALERFGYLPEDELVYGEDMAWGVAATARGARLAWVADAVVTHRGGAAGASRSWVGAVSRLARSQLGPVRGSLAVAAMTGGLTMRSLLGRRPWRVEDPR